MISESSILNTTNDELRKLLLNYSLTCGPVQDSTRSLYEKKLLKHLKSIGSLEKHTIIPGLSTAKQSQQITIMDLNNNESIYTPPSSLIEHKTVSSQTSFDQLSSLTDAELMANLKKHGFNLVPVTASTRSTYIKKLQKCLDTPIQIIEEEENHEQIVQAKSEPFIQKQPDIQIIEDDNNDDDYAYRQVIFSL